MALICGSAASPAVRLVIASSPLTPTQHRTWVAQRWAWANAHLPPAQHLEVSPHVLRHTLLRKMANEKGVRYAMELSGHRSDRYI
jgi:integrase